MLFDVGWRCKFRHWLTPMGRQYLSSQFHDRSGRMCAFLVGRLAILECPIMIEWFRRRFRDVDKDWRISCLKNQILRKSQGPNIAKREKNLKNGHFGRNPATRISRVASDHAPMVAGDHGAGDLGLWSTFRSPSGRSFLVVSRAFSLLFSPVFFFDISPHLMAWFHWRKPIERLWKSEHKVSYFWKSRRLCSRFSATSWS